MKKRANRRTLPTRQPLGKKGKRRTLKVVVPKVGDCVAIRWVDSGFFAYRIEDMHESLELDMIITYGVVVHRDEHKTVLASEHGDNMDDGAIQLRNTIWNKAIFGCVILRKGNGSHQKSK